MALSSSAIAGVVMGIICVLMLGLVALYYTIRHRQRNTPSKTATVASPTGSDSGSPTLSPPQLAGFQNRAGISDLPYQQPHTRYPSLEHGPGPTLVITPGPDTPAIGTIRAVMATPETSSTSTRVQPFAAAASDNRSSLHQAMLDVGAEDGQKRKNDTVKEGRENVRGKDLKHNPVGKAYTGAWPLRDASSAFEGR